MVAWIGHWREADGHFYWTMRRVGGEGMKNHKLLFALILAGAIGTGCERRVARASLPDLVIPVTCASEITLMHCDARISPPKCAGARVRYRNGCEQIVARSATAKP
jgi:hypothetical protein